MSDVPSTGEIDRPQFCPWCGTPTPYRPETRAPLWLRAAEQSGQEAPEVLQEVLHTEAYVTGCPGCRRVSHVVGHEAHPA